MNSVKQHIQSKPDTVNYDRTVHIVHCRQRFVTYILLQLGFHACQVFIDTVSLIILSIK